MHLDGLDRGGLPSRPDILAGLGPPHESLAGGGVLEYRYRLHNAGPAAAKAQVTAWFDPGSDEIERLQLRYLRYQLDADFAAERAVISFDM